MKSPRLSLLLKAISAWIILTLTGCLASIQPVKVILDSTTPTPFIREKLVASSTPTSVGRKVATMMPIPAFPGAEGFGANAVGGRAGKIIFVTNLNDAGSGSLREAVNAVGPRIVIFQVIGTIELKTSLEITQPFRGGGREAGHLQVPRSFG